MSKGNSNFFHIENLNVLIPSSKGHHYYAVKNCSFNIPKGKTLGLVGESGSGKSLTALSLMRLLPQGLDWSCTKMVLGEINLNDVPKNEYHRQRGKFISMIFQEPMTSLNPLMEVGKQIAEVFQIHQHLSFTEAMKKSSELFSLVGIPDAEQRLKSYPHQLSGGMRQRAMIAMALACSPKLLIADEPTTALDVTIQAQIISLINNLQKINGMSCLIITHDLGVVAESCDEVAVMYAGSIVEQGATQDVLKSPKHPYTAGLLDSLPSVQRQEKELFCIPGHIPPLESRNKGCLFHNRCPRAKEKCIQESPKLERIVDSHKAACFFPLVQNRGSSHE